MQLHLELAHTLIRIDPTSLEMGLDISAGHPGCLGSDLLKVTSIRAFSKPVEKPLDKKKGVRI